MFNEKFTELDNDFITVWSNFLYGGDMEPIDKKLTTLAEMGQVQAMQKYYMFHGVGENPIIDDNVDKIDILSMTAQEYKAKANKYFAEKKNEINNLLTAQVLATHKLGGASLYAIQNKNELNVEKIKSRLRDNLYIKFAQKAIRLGFEDGETNADWCLVEEANEWAKEFPEILCTDKTVLKRISQADTLAPTLRSKFKNSLTHVDTETFADEEFKPNTLRNPASKVAFAYAKSMCLFNDKTQNQIIGRNLLYKLKSRPLSEKLQSRLNSKYPEDYEENTKPDDTTFPPRDNYIDYAKESEKLSETKSFKSVCSIREM